MRLRYLTRLTTAFIFRFRTLLILGIIFGVVIFLGISVVLPALLGGKHDRIALIGAFHTSDLPHSILSLIGEGLTTLDETGQAQPALASSWESTDGKTWKFTLADGKTWQDGTPVVSGSIRYSFQDVTISHPDAKTIVFTLKDSFAPFPTVVSKPTFKKGLLGTGSWKVDKITLSGSAVDEVILKDSANNRKTFRFYPTEEKAKIAFKLGDVDEMVDLASATPFDKWENVKVESKTNYNRFVSVFFNTQSEALADKRTRQALSYAIEKNKFGLERALSTVSPLSWAYNPQTKPYDYDEKRAIELLKSVNQSNEVQINLATTPLLLDIAEQIAKDWEKVGVKTTVQVASTLPDDYQAYVAIYDAPSDPDQYATWHSTQSITKFHNIRVDKLLEEGRQELDMNKRKTIYLDFQRFLLEDAPLAVLYHPLSYQVTRK